MNAILASYTGLISTYDYYGTGSTINRTTKEGATAVTEAITFLTNQASATPLTALTWSPGLYQSALL